jgi:hypothetical protein
MFNELRRLCPGCASRVGGFATTALGWPTEKVRAPAIGCPSADTTRQLIT